MILQLLEFFYTEFGWDITIFRITIRYSKVILFNYVFMCIIEGCDVGILIGRRCPLFCTVAQIVKQIQGVLKPSHKYNENSFFYIIIKIIAILIIIVIIITSHYVHSHFIYEKDLNPAKFDHVFLNSFCSYNKKTTITWSYELFFFIIFDTWIIIKVYSFLNKIVFFFLLGSHTYITYIHIRLVWMFRRMLGQRGSLFYCEINVCGVCPIISHQFITYQVIPFRRVEIWFRDILLNLYFWSIIAIVLTIVHCQTLLWRILFLGYGISLSVLL